MPSRSERWCFRSRWYTSRVSWGRSSADQKRTMTSNPQGGTRVPPPTLDLASGVAHHQVVAGLGPGHRDRLPLLLVGLLVEVVDGEPVPAHAVGDLLLYHVGVKRLAVLPVTLVLLQDAKDDGRGLSATEPWTVIIPGR